MSEDNLTRAIERGMGQLLRKMEGYLVGTPADKLVYQRLAAEMPAAVLAALRETGAIVRSAETADWPVVVRVLGSLEEYPFTETYETEVTIGEQIFGTRVDNRDPGSDDREFITYFAGVVLASVIKAATEPLHEKIALAMWRAKHPAVTAPEAAIPT